MDKNLIDIITRSYMISKSILRENELGICRKTEDRLKQYRFHVHHIEYVVSCLDEEDRFIILNEVIEGKKGDWYREYMSAPTYYRHRKLAYSNFLSRLEQ
ncbi:MAG: hypothetical protein IKF68_03835 [Erysipelotrichaceae bacterium]|nr:hypothetical protein [Erysipelotrichaceae bacterium]